MAAAGQALRPLSPVHAQIRPDGAGGLTIGWPRRSRIDTGWRDHVDQPLGETRELWRVSLVPPVPGVGPWGTGVSALHLGAGETASLTSGHELEIRLTDDTSPTLEARRLGNE